MQSAKADRNARERVLESEKGKPFQLEGSVLPYNIEYRQDRHGQGPVHNTKLMQLSCIQFAACLLRGR